ncbi:3-phosphoinositide-dependent protein kinase 1 [Zancudomyces culisetae]|uniref:non-specific serine/threonine protein kinase n=1 Tax=Zancudomyces culisetae TaxID=1213189 RepID=A0A1R1PWW7_ZANCU|nr:3-phosphoinositide-dependent protein kinase 1 [Zancudomyces culisetae]|eukprot:OMH85448.1 3-phosphoinositide-dependent protein kinase 1 [Zancudomyces culisetae]
MENMFIEETKKIDIRKDNKSERYQETLESFKNQTSKNQQGSEINSTGTTEDVERSHTDFKNVLDNHFRINTFLGSTGFLEYNIKTGMVDLKNKNEAGVEGAPGKNGERIPDKSIPAIEPNIPETVSKRKEKKKITDFYLGRIVGEGSFSQVFEATEIASNKVYAAKVIDKRQIVKVQMAKYIRIEQEALERLDHPLIIKLNYTIQDPLKVYFILEMVENGDLLLHIRREGKLNEDKARFYLAQLVLAIEYMHKNNVVHRDLKPENILVREDGRILVTDFGSCKLIDKAGEEESVARKGSFVGTPEYVTPELLESRETGKEADYWALGCVAYYLMTGRHPFKGVDVHATYEKITNLNYEIPRGLSIQAVRFIHLLLSTPASKRLGSSSHLGIGEIKSHEFFKKVDWKMINNVVYGILNSPINRIIEKKVGVSSMGVENVADRNTFNNPNRQKSPMIPPRSKKIAGKYVPMSESKPRAVLTNKVYKNNGEKSSHVNYAHEYNGDDESEAERVRIKLRRSRAYSSDKQRYIKPNRPSKNMSFGGSRMDLGNPITPLTSERAVLNIRVKGDLSYEDLLLNVNKDNGYNFQQPLQQQRLQKPRKLYQPKQNQQYQQRRASRFQHETKEPFIGDGDSDSDSDNDNDNDNEEDNYRKYRARNTRSGRYRKKGAVGGGGANASLGGGRNKNEYIIEYQMPVKPSYYFQNHNTEAMISRPRVIRRKGVVERGVSSIRSILCCCKH